MQPDVIANVIANVVTTVVTDGVFSLNETSAYADGGPNLNLFLVFQEIDSGENTILG